MKIRQHSVHVAQSLTSFLILVVLSGCNSVVEQRQKTIWHPEPLELRYRFGNNEFNSVECYVRKDLVMDGYATAFFCLNDYDKYRIWRIVREMEMEELPPRVGSGVGWERKLTLRVGSIEKDIAWDISGEPANDTEAWLIALEDVLNDILRPVFQSMPPPRGARL